jgi:signal transduction histidine kinase
VTALGKLFRTTVFKISLAYLVMFAIGAGLVLGNVGANVKSLIEEQIAQTVAADIAGLSEQYAQGGIHRLAETIENRSRRPGARLYLVTNASGETIAGNVQNLPADLLLRSGLIETIYETPGGSHEKRRALARIFVLPGGYRVLVGHDLEEGESLRNILSGALVTSLTWLVIIGTLGGLFVASRVLNRVDAINAEAQSIVAGDLSGRLPLAGTGDELDRLVQNVNAMLERIALLMAGLKEVTDNIAHDLKTPLTRLRSRAEQALRMAESPQDYRGALEKVLEESDRLIHIFDALLEIASAEAGACREGMIDFDVAAVARDVGELYEPVAEERGIAFHVSAPPSLMLHGSRELISQALANLVDNALKYGDLGGGKGDATRFLEGGMLGPVTREVSAKTIDIAVQLHADGIELSVADRGPGIAAKDRVRVMDRFVRLENARSRPGSGLGLSLAVAVARLHNGVLRLEDNRPGLRAVIALPASQTAPLSRQGHANLKSAAA